MNEWVIFKSGSIPDLYVQAITPPTEGVYYTASLTNSPDNAMQFDSEEDANQIIDLLDPALEFVGKRPKRK